jgi:outer membrane immunogenic protein
MLRKILLSTVLIAAAAGSAAAADLPRRGVAPAPYLAAPVFTWTGFYVGLNAGAGFNNKHNGFVAGPGFTGGTAISTVGGGFGDNGNNDAGFTGGVQAGYNFQISPMFVVGVEADINYLDRGNDRDVIVTDGTSDYRFHRGDSNNWFGTVRGRVGLAFDRFLPYFTGGWAFGGKQGGVSGTYIATGTTGAGVALVGGGDSGSSSGWTLGGGVEYAFSNNMSFKVEYLHVKLGDNNTQLAVASGTTSYFAFKNENKFDVVRAGVNFRF